MMHRILAGAVLGGAMLAGGCGSVANTHADAAVDGSGLDGPPGAVMWKNQPADVKAKMFGGTAADGTMYCQYTITLKQLDVQLTILPSGQVTSGRVQDLNVEAVIPSTTLGCTATNPPPIPANIATYQLAAAMPSTGGLTLTFQDGPTNAPPATLVIELTKVSSLYSAKLTFQRNDGLDPVFEWTVTTTVPLAPQ